jgi:hypothetical protein
MTKPEHLPDKGDPCTCAMCGLEFFVANTFAENKAECQIMFPNVPLEDCCSVCDDCYRALMARN